MLSSMPLLGERSYQLPIHPLFTVQSYAAANGILSLWQWLTLIKFIMFDDDRQYLDKAMHKYEKSINYYYL